MTVGNHLRNAEVNLNMLYINSASPKAAQVILCAACGSVVITLSSDVRRQREREREKKKPNRHLLSTEGIKN